MSHETQNFEHRVYYDEFAPSGFVEVEEPVVADPEIVTDIWEAAARRSDVGPHLGKLALGNESYPVRFDTS